MFLRCIDPHPNPLNYMDNLEMRIEYYLYDWKMFRGVYFVKISPYGMVYWNSNRFVVCQD